MRKIDLEKERAYENKKVSGELERNNQSKFYWATSIPMNRHNRTTFSAIQDKDVLEIGCSVGELAKDYTKYTSSYLGIDLSDEAIRSASKYGLPNSTFICCDAHELPSEDAKFDCVIVNGLLHHLDLSLIFPEISRVLKLNGVLIFREPLGTNPIFQLYRRLTPSARTPDERPFTFDDLDLMKKYFKLDNLDWYGFSNIFSAFLRIGVLRKVLTSFDNLLSKTPIKYFYWQFSGFAMKR